MLLGPKTEPGSAYTLVQEVKNMAAANLIARFESKLDAQTAQFASLRWMVGLGFALLALLVTLLRFLG